MPTSRCGYNAINETTIRYEQLVKLLKDNKSMTYDMGVEALPKYFVEKKKKTGTVKVWFESPGRNDSIETHTATFPAYLDDWNNVWVVITKPLRVTGPDDDVAWQFFESVLDKLNC